MDGMSSERLHQFVERIERLEEEKRALGEDLTETYQEVKAAGFDPKIVKILVKERRMSEDDRAAQAALLDVYRRALGMFADTPLGEAAMASAVWEHQAKPKPKRSKTNGTGEAHP